MKNPTNPFSIAMIILIFVANVISFEIKNVCVRSDYWKRLISESSLSGERGVELRRFFRSLEPDALNPRLPIPQSIVSFILLAPRYLGVPAVANK